MRTPYFVVAAVSLALVACSSAEDDSAKSDSAIKNSCKTTAPASPPICLEIYEPVCGCDGKTYGNTCEAEPYVGTWTEGACEQSGSAACEVSKPKVTACAEIYAPVCGCNGETYGNACEAGIYVTAWDDGACAPAGPACKIPAPEPRFCPQVAKPVCGCDGKTYGNACAAGEFVTSWIDGACK